MLEDVQQEAGQEQRTWTDPEHHQNQTLDHRCEKRVGLVVETSEQETHSGAEIVETPQHDPNRSSALTTLRDKVL